MENPHIGINVKAAAGTVGVAYAQDNGIANRIIDADAGTYLGI
jgi:hypothetical protein